MRDSPSPTADEAVTQNTSDSTILMIFENRSTSEAAVSMPRPPSGVADSALCRRGSACLKAFAPASSQPPSQPYLEMQAQSTGQMAHPPATKHALKGARESPWPRLAIRLKKGEKSLYRIDEPLRLLKGFTPLLDNASTH